MTDLIAGSILILLIAFFAHGLIAGVKFSLWAAPALSECWLKSSTAFAVSLLITAILTFVGVAILICNSATFDLLGPNGVAFCVMYLSAFAMGVTVGWSE